MPKFNGWVSGSDPALHGGSREDAHNTDDSRERAALRAETNQRPITTKAMRKAWAELQARTQANSRPSTGEGQV